LLRVEGLSKHFGMRGRGTQSLRAVDDVSFEVHARECLAIVGESGSGKSTLARALLRLIEPTSGSVYFQGRDLLQLSKREVRRVRRHIQMIFQDPYASLHPRRTVADIISEPWRVHTGLVERGARPARGRELLQQVGLPTGYTSLYPSRLSGGERQRVAIARALALRPDLLVLDEPVSALDVSIQAQVISVLMKLHREQGLAYLFISHDLALVRLVADRVAVMYLGKFMEIAATDELFANPTHPYTQALLGASPSLGDLHAVDLQAFSAADTVSPLILPSGCRFRTRCWKAQERCAVEEPALIVRELAGASHAVADHLSACHFPEVSLPAWLSPADPADGEGTVAQPNAVSVATPARSGRAPDPEDANTA